MTLFFSFRVENWNSAADSSETGQFLVETRLKEWPWQWMGESVHRWRSIESSKENNQEIARTEILKVYVKEKGEHVVRKKASWISQFEINFIGGQVIQDSNLEKQRGTEGFKGWGVVEWKSRQWPELAMPGEKEPSTAPLNIQDETRCMGQRQTTKRDGQWITLRVLKQWSQISERASSCWGVGGGNQERKLSWRVATFCGTDRATIPRRTGNRKGGKQWMEMRLREGNGGCVIASQSSIRG